MVTWALKQMSRVHRPTRHPPAQPGATGCTLNHLGSNETQLKSSVTPAAPHVLSRLADTTSSTANPRPRLPGTAWGPATVPCKCVSLGGAHQQVDTSLRGGHSGRTSPRPGLCARRQKGELMASWVLLPGSL